MTTFSKDIMSLGVAFLFMTAVAVLTVSALPRYGVLVVVVAVGEGVRRFALRCCCKR